MKSVGKQLQEARLAKNWTPELASRETKIKLERLRDLEADDYTHFTSPAYARGFVRTYARALSLDEYKILRQLDHKLPEDDHSTLVHEPSGVTFAPVPPRTTRATDTSNSGLFVVMGLGFGVAMVLAFVLFEAYRSGDLPRYFGKNGEATASSSDVTNAPAASTAEAAKALPVDPNAPDTHSARALPVDPNAVPPSPTATTADTAPAPTNAPDAAPVAPAAPAATAATDVVPGAVKALPVDPSTLTTNGAPVSAVVAPPTDAAPVTAPPVVAVTPAVTDATAVGSTPDAPTKPSASARASNSGVKPSAPPRALPVDPSELTGAAVAPEPPPMPVSAGPVNAPSSGGNSTPVLLNDAGLPVHTPAPSTDAAPVATVSGKRLVLTASHDSFLRVTAEDAPDVERVLYASVLHGGQSVSFDGRKFTINVGIPSVVDISLDGVNYGPHSDANAPETFTLESHQP